MIESYWLIFAALLALPIGFFLGFRCLACWRCKRGFPNVCLDCCKDVSDYAIEQDRANARRTSVTR